ncbi:phage protein GemA/Gp16 family protein [Campylobacter sp. 9BO]|uniref:phage protein GemA/Gp16 family protein n=1 Tax=Campylobacter sp. 9BO TaxID=3424759 RepID=UPI003D356BDD
MNRSQAELKRYYIKMIHTLKGSYFIDDECRKIHLQSTYGTDSLKNLNIEQLREVLSLCGYKAKKHKVKENIKAKNDREYASQKQLDTITGIWNEVARVKSEMALRDFIYRIVKYRPLYLKHLKRDEASDIVRALKNMKREFYKNDKQL